MTQSPSPISTAPVPVSGDDLDLAISQRIVAKRQFETTIANHQAIVDKNTARHAALQAEIDEARVAYKADQPWTPPVNSVLDQVFAEQSSMALINRGNRQTIPPRPNIRPPNPPAAGTAAPAPA